MEKQARSIRVKTPHSNTFTEYNLDSIIKIMEYESGSISIYFRGVEDDLYIGGPEAVTFMKYWHEAMNTIGDMS